MHCYCIYHWCKINSTFITLSLLISPMKSKHLLLLLILLACITFASAAEVNVTVDTPVVNTPYISEGLWIMITLLGLGFMILANITVKNTGAAIWALISPFFMIASAYFASNIEHVEVTTVYDSATGTFNVLSQHFVYHVDWFAQIMGIMFVLSFINMWYIWLVRIPAITAAKKEDVMGTRSDD